MKDDKTFSNDLLHVSLIEKKKEEGKDKKKSSFVITNALAKDIKSSLTGITAGQSKEGRKGNEGPQIEAIRFFFFSGT